MGAKNVLEERLAEIRAEAEPEPEITPVQVTIPTAQYRYLEELAHALDTSRRALGGRLLAEALEEASFRASELNLPSAPTTDEEEG